MKGARLAVAVLATGLLLAPALMMATVWTPVDLLVAVAAILVCFLSARYAKRWRWACAIVASLVISVPPYPYWLFASEERGWYFHFFHGYTIADVPFIRFLFVMFAAILMFGAIFWSMDKAREQLESI